VDVGLRTVSVTRCWLPYTNVIVTKIKNFFETTNFVINIGHSYRLENCYKAFLYSVFMIDNFVFLIYFTIYSYILPSEFITTDPMGVCFIVLHESLSYDDCK
jgi:hypothetical protein